MVRLEEDTMFSLQQDRKRLNLQIKKMNDARRERIAVAAMQGLLSAVYSSKEMLNEFLTSKYLPRKEGVSDYCNGNTAVSQNPLNYSHPPI